MAWVEVAKSSSDRSIAGIGVGSGVGAIFMRRVGDVSWKDNMRAYLAEFLE